LVTNSIFAYYFNSILTKGKKDNTYKFALARFLLDYSHKLDDSYIKIKIENDTTETISFSNIAKSFLKYYWHQICKYKIKQNFNPNKLPFIVRIIQNIFGEEYIPDPFDSINKDKILNAEKEITKKCFSEVIPRFQNISDGVNVLSNNIFYEYSRTSIFVKPQALHFFNHNYSFLLKATILEWSKFLEKINIGLPMLISKIEGYERQRRSLENFKDILRKYFDKCFYCNNNLPLEKQMIHVDHFIPWSYIYEDELWNLVLSCRRCNLVKHSSLPADTFIYSLVNRNNNYSNVIEVLRKSLLRLDLEQKYESAIRKHYQNCIDFGFTVQSIKYDF
jgi:hypothetical protein